jgi:hypothetical protein
MFRKLLALTALATGVAVGAPLQAQSSSSVISVKRGELELTPYAGYIFTGHFANGPLSSSLGSGNGAVYGVQLALPLAPSASLVGGLAYSSADLQVQALNLVSQKVGTSVAWLYEGDLQLQAPAQKSGIAAGAVPFLQVGAGAIHRQLTAFGLNATSTDFAMNGGVGFDYVISQGLALRLLAKDYIGKATFDNDLAQTNTLNNFVLSAGVRLSF